MDQGKKQKLIDAAFALVAEVGLENFSMAKVAAKAGTSERLIYNHFKTKEALLSTCFASINADLSEVFSDPALLDWQNADSTVEFIRVLWLRFFEYLVCSGNRAIFLFEYRNSTRFRESAEKDPILSDCYFSDFTQMFHSIDELYHVTDRKSVV